MSRASKRTNGIAGLVSVASRFGPEETMNRLEAAVRARGLTVFASVDHAAGAAAAGLPLMPTELLVFGNAATGTPLMQVAQTIGIDLPLKVLVWQDETGKTRLAYNDPSWLARRHHLSADTTPTIDAMTALLAALAADATDAA